MRLPFPFINVDPSYRLPGDVKLETGHLHTGWDGSRYDGGATVYAADNVRTQLPWAPLTLGPHLRTAPRSGDVETTRSIRPLPEPARIAYEKENVDPAGPTLTCSCPKKRMYPGGKHVGSRA